MKKRFQVSFLVEKMFKAIPIAELKRIFDENETRFVPSRDYVRLQPRFPRELFAALIYYGAFNNGEADFFVQRAFDWIEHKAIELGLTNVLRQHQNGTNGHGEDD